MPGYWRLSELSEDVIECMNNSDNCIGGGYGDETCVEGHTGPLCEECDVKYLKILILIK